jgi:UDP-N-acetylmuramoylalanine--D-glutamate ligase
MPGTMTKLAFKNVLVFGLGRSGLAAARAIRAQGAQVTVTDAKPVEKLGEWPAKLSALGVPLMAGGHPESLLDGKDLLVLSPGVPNNLPILKEAGKRGLPRFSELELAYQLSKCKWVAITGTNGKTTTTALAGELFKQAGQPSLVGGNIGLALSDQVEALGPEATVVAEVSSFQLDDIRDFRPSAAAILNITPDHLDRYAGLEAYAASKARIFENQGPQDFAVLNASDPRLVSLGKTCRSRVLWFSGKSEVVSGAFARSGKVFLRMPGRPEREVLAVEEIGIQGPHNLENALAALCLGAASGLDLASMAQALKSFKGVEHRLEPCGQIRGVRFINDSKGTNVDSVEKALQSFSQPIHLILGGRDKAGDFTTLSSLIRERVKALYFVGEAAAKIEGQVGQLKPGRRVADMDDAVRQAFKASASGDVVLLSPGCASFDMFQNYEHRGRVFKEEVRRLAAELGEKL